MEKSSIMPWFIFGASNVNIVEISGVSILLTLIQFNNILKREFPVKLIFNTYSYAS
jgi:hypothetical protein